MWSTNKTKLLHEDLWKYGERISTSHTWPLGHWHVKYSLSLSLALSPLSLGLALFCLSPSFLTLSHSLALSILSPPHYGSPYRLDDSSAADTGVSMCNKAPGWCPGGPIGLDKGPTEENGVRSNSLLPSLMWNKRPAVKLGSQCNLESDLLENGLCTARCKWKRLVVCDIKRVQGRSLKYTHTHAIQGKSSNSSVWLFCYSVKMAELHLKDHLKSEKKKKKKATRQKYNKEHHRRIHGVYCNWIVEL